MAQAQTDASRQLAAMVARMAQLEVHEGARLQADLQARQGHRDEAARGLDIVATGERRFYGCFIFKKGVVPPDA